MGAFIRRPPEADSGDEAVPAIESLLGRWGLVPWATKDPAKQLKLSTFNARAESAATCEPRSRSMTPANIRVAEDQLLQRVLPRGDGACSRRA
jgi:hypothetical protein